MTKTLMKPKSRNIDKTRSNWSPKERIKKCRQGTKGNANTDQEVMKSAMEALDDAVEVKNTKLVWKLALILINQMVCLSQRWCNKAQYWDWRLITL